jgi:hypothetical protein
VARFGGLGALALGSLGPWAHVLFMSVSGTSGDGQLTLGAAVIGALALGLRGRGAGAIVAAVVSLLALAAAGYDLINISHLVSQATLDGTQVATVGWGLYLTVAGAAVALTGSVMQVRRNRRAKAAAAGH